MLTSIKEIIKEYCLIIIIAEFVVILLLLFWRFLFSHDRSDEIESLKNENYGLKKKLAVKENELDKYAKAYLKTRTELRDEQNKHLFTKEDPKSPVIEFDLSQDSKEPIISPNSQVSYEFLQEANGGRFMKLLPSSEKCYFRTWKEDGVRKYEFWGNVPKALANINAIFDDACDIEGRRGGATDIENVSPGILDEDLRIINKAKIRLK